MGTKRGIDADTANAHLSTVLCCSCGTPMVANQTMRCAQCLQSEISITDGISRQCVMPHCRNCQRYQGPPWTKCELESRELLGMCLKRVKGINKEVRLVDAAFIWTEEHCRRIKVKLTVQKEVAKSSVLQQTIVVEFVVVNQQCEECQRSFTPHEWTAIVQVRQKVLHRRSFCYLEQLILKNDAHSKVVSLKETREGLDFHFGQRSHAQRFADFIESCFPTNVKTSKQLVSHDANSNTYNYKYSLYAEISPICNDDLVHVTRGHSMLMSGAPQLMLCHKVSTAVHLVDPITLRGYDLPANEYWKRPLQPVATRAHLTEFVVLSMEPVDHPERRGEGVEAPAGPSAARHHLAGRKKMQLADIEVARLCDFGNNDERMTVRSHMGRVLRPGNHVLGYDLRHVNMSGIDSESMEESRVDAIFVRKVFKRKKGRAWGVLRLPRNAAPDEPRIDDEADMEAMRQDLEEDPDMRRGVNMYREEGDAKTASAAARGAAADAAPVGELDGDDEDGGEDEDAPEVPLAELLEGLNLSEDHGPPVA